MTVNIHTVAQCITQHKRFVPYGTHPNFCFAKTSFMLEPLYDIASQYNLDKWGDMNDKQKSI